MVEELSYRSGWVAGVPQRPYGRDAVRTGRDELRYACRGHSAYRDNRKSECGACGHQGHA